MPPLLSPMNPEDENVPFEIDFSNLLAAGETIQSMVSVIAVPNTITVSTGTIGDGKKTACAVQFTLGLGVLNQTYTVTAEIVTTNNVNLARSTIVPVEGV